MKHETRWPWWLAERWICWHCYGVERDVLHCLHDERRLRERLTFVWGVAMAHGATSEELAADLITREPRST